MQVKIYKGFKSFSKSLDITEKTEISSTVQEILNKVRISGDAALREYT
ncbi:MAG TPA: histidinol dehydrogenase, partial [Deltaproteobacteria bacterium]|nr:histidinol dehydrogenase [Deltaproteobacteria bacterium]